MAQLYPDSKNVPMAAYVDLLLPALRGYERYVEKVTLWTDHAADSIMLGVTHKLFDRQELQNGDYKRLFRSRINKMCLVPDGAKRMRMERRQLLLRGKEAQAARRKRVR